MRRNFVLGFVVAGLFVMAAPAAAIPPPPVTVYISKGPYGCSVDGTKVVLDQEVEWARFFGSSGTRTVQQKQGFWSFSVGSNEPSRVMSSAGTYQQRCDTSDYSMSDPIKVPLKASRVSGNSFKITWATSKAPSTLRYSVRYRVGSGSYRVWRSGVSVRSATFTARDGKAYSFQARSIKAGKATDWSPEKKFTG